MKTFVQAISQAEKFSTKKEKFAALTGLDKIGQRLVREALDPYRVFGVRKYDAPKIFNTKDSQEYFNRFFGLLDDLHSRKLTGNAARTAVTNTLGLFTKETASYLARVLNKDLDCGANESTFNKIYPGIIPTFEVMLASKIDEKYKWDFPCIAEAKYDGTRLIAVCENGVVEYFSRSGKPSDFCNGIFDAELAKMEKRVGAPIVLDGEALASDFTETLNAKGSKGVEAKKALRFYAFDIMFLSEWKAQNCNRKQAVRSAIVEALVNELDLKLIKKSKHKTIHNLIEAKAFYNEMLKEGFEGLIIKKPEAMYEFDRSKNWSKWKPCFSVDGKILSVYEGRPGSRLVGMLGGITVGGEDENGNKFECDCGSGFSDQMRNEIWSKRKSVIGKMVEIEYQEMSKVKGRNEFSLRFPVFVKFRPDKD